MQAQVDQRERQHVRGDDRDCKRDGESDQDEHDRPGVNAPDREVQGRDQGEQGGPAESAAGGPQQPDDPADDKLPQGYEDPHGIDNGVPPPSGTMGQYPLLR